MTVRPTANGKPKSASEIAGDVGTLLRVGRLADAQWTLRQRLLAAPSDLASISLLADVELALGNVDGAMALLRRIVALDPLATGVRVKLARILVDRGDLRAALELIEGAAAPAGGAQFELRTFEAFLAGTLGDLERAIEIYRQLIDDGSRDPRLWSTLATALKTLGRTDEAIAAYQAAIRAKPNYGEPYWGLANLKTFRFAPRDLSAIRKQLARNPSPEDAAHLHFALGKALEDAGQHGPAYRHYEQGNRLRAGQIPAAAMIMTPRVDAAIEAFDSALFEKAGDAGDPSNEPIFVVGLQRSGSTLIEQILASHPLIEGTAELPVAEQIWAEVATMGRGSGDPFAEIVRLSPSEIARLGATYLERTRPFRRTDRPRFVDKLPANWLNVGFLRLILPNAKIVDARRHPLACGFSNFKQLYATGVTFAYSQESIGRFYRDYLRLMRHFDHVQPGLVHHLLNERLIEDPEGEIRRLLDFVGVPFDPACLDFHRTKRAVATPSAEQVRRPISRAGMDNWKPFAPHLGPLKEALGDALENWAQTA